MVALLALIGSAAASTVLVVATPGVDTEGYLPLLASLHEAGHQTELVSFPCAGDAQAMSEAVVRAAEGVEGPYTVLAHGLGATLALQATPGMSPERLVLLAPVLDIPPTAGIARLATREIAARVDLSVPTGSTETDPRTVLLGEERPALSCVSAAFVRDVQRWITAGEIPLPLEDIAVPVWIGISLLDEVSATEVVVHASRRLPNRELVRLGVNRMDPMDYRHGQMLLAPVPIRAAVKAVSP